MGNGLTGDGIMIEFTDNKTGKTLLVFPAESFKYGSQNQRRFADTVSAKYILITGDNRGRLPLWTMRVLKENNLWYRKIGCTTYKSNTFALYDERMKP
jgi:hypothetical protein